MRNLIALVLGLTLVCTPVLAVQVGGAGHASGEVSDATFVWHLGFADFLFITGQPIEQVSANMIHPDTVNDTIYAPLGVPYQMFGGTVVLDQITVYYYTADNGDDFDFDLYRADHDGTVTSDASEANIGNGGSGYASETILTGDVTLADFAYSMSFDVNNTNVDTNVKIIDVKIEAHLE